MLITRLHIFPLLQVVFLGAAFLTIESFPIVSVIFIVISALFMNFGLHITIHHFVHFRFKNRFLNIMVESIYSLLLSLPFTFYKIQHYNHHRYNNSLDDFTTTWREIDGDIVPKKFFTYSFFWFVGGSLNRVFMKAKTDGDYKEGEGNRMRYQFVTIIAFYVFLFWLNPIYCLIYFIHFYLGWSFIAITNYGQHLPITYGSPVGYSYSPKWYNRLFFNNGLHYEHHDHPAKDYPELKAEHKAEIRVPHLLMGLFQKK